MKHEDSEKRMSEDETLNKSPSVSSSDFAPKSGRRHWLLAGVGQAWVVRCSLGKNFSRGG